MDLPSIKYRLTHGLPISVEESRYLYKLATQEKLPDIIKRCRTCEGSGQVKCPDCQSQ